MLSRDDLDAAHGQPASHVGVTRGVGALSEADVARALADMREASALVETVDRFRHEFGDADEDGRLDRIRVALVRRMRAASDRSPRAD